MIGINDHVRKIKTIRATHRVAAKYEQESRTYATFLQKVSKNSRFVRYARLVLPVCQHTHVQCL